MMNADPLGQADQQLNELRGRLTITTDQEEAWGRYADAVKGRAGLMLSHRQVMFSGGQITPEQRFAFHQQGQAQMQNIANASRTLYGVLSPEQRARAGNLMSLQMGPR